MELEDEDVPIDVVASAAAVGSSPTELVLRPEALKLLPCVRGRALEMEDDSWADQVGVRASGSNVTATSRREGSRTPPRKVNEERLVEAVTTSTMDLHTRHEQLIEGPADGLVEESIGFELVFTSKDI